ncbi:hypothetical protein MPSEU_000751900 [Mayamaea pseudoterrestris]|nr:hypothetical protein MPSEU_000751900 [Mayamaea pseudoterrestris]
MTMPFLSKTTFALTVTLAVAVVGAFETSGETPTTSGSSSMLQLPFPIGSSNHQPLRLVQAPADEEMQTTLIQKTRQPLPFDTSDLSYMSVCPSRSNYKMEATMLTNLNDRDEQEVCFADLSVCSVGFYQGSDAVKDDVSRYVTKTYVHNYQFTCLDLASARGERSKSSSKSSSIDDESVDGETTLPRLVMMMLATFWALFVCKVTTTSDEPTLSMTLAPKAAASINFGVPPKATTPSTGSSSCFHYDDSTSAATLQQPYYMSDMPRFTIYPANHPKYCGYEHIAALKPAEPIKQYIAKPTYSNYNGGYASRSQFFYA